MYEKRDGHKEIPPIFLHFPHFLTANECQKFYKYHFSFLLSVLVGMQFFFELFTRVPIIESETIDRISVTLID